MVESLPRLTLSDADDFAFLDHAAARVPYGTRRAVIAAGLQSMLRVALRVDDLDVAWSVDPATTETHFTIHVRGVSAVLLRDPKTASQVKDLLARARERFTGILERVPEADRAEEARELSDADLAHRARALRGAAR